MATENPGGDRGAPSSGGPWAGLPSRARVGPTLPGSSCGFRTGAFSSAEPCAPPGRSRGRRRGPERCGGRRIRRGDTSAPRCTRTAEGARETGRAKSTRAGEVALAAARQGEGAGGAGYCRCGGLLPQASARARGARRDRRPPRALGAGAGVPGRKAPKSLGAGRVCGGAPGRAREDQ